MSAVPWSMTSRAETRTSKVRLGVWLFLASEAMFFGALFSGYALLRTGTAGWPDAATMLNSASAYAMTPLLLLALGGLHMGRAGSLRARLLAASLPAVLFAAMKVMDYREKIAAGLLPSTNLLLACWFTLTAVHAAHVAGGIAANLWAAGGAGRDAARDGERLHALRLYWLFVDIVWLAILVGFYLV